DVLTGEQCADLAIAVDGADARRAGSRKLLDLPSCRELAATFKAHSEIGRLFPAGSVAVQCTLCDKSPDKNWLVALHQDLSMPVLERISQRDINISSYMQGVVY